MAWTSPKTWVGGASLSATELNTELRDNLLYLYAQIVTHSIQHARQSAGSMAPGDQTTVNVTWGVAFADTNYTLVSSVFNAGDTSIQKVQCNPVGKTAAGCSVRVINNGAGTITPVVQVIAVHD